MASFPGYFTLSFERCEEYGLLIQGKLLSPTSWIYLRLSERAMSLLALVAESFVAIQLVSRVNGFARCLCREQSTGSLSWFNKLISKAHNYGLFQ